MAVKDKVLDILDANRGDFLSGEQLADSLGCTRGAIWKAVKVLQEQGYPISAVTNKGYSLDENTDILSLAGVKKYLVPERKDMDIEAYKEVTSTNLLLKDCANQGASEGKVIIAGAQTQGRGRLGRSFFSPSDSGLYLSILLRPNMAAQDAVKITTAAAVSVALAVESVSDLKPDIKWVNDIYINGRKICGILTEASFSMESGGLDYAVLGIGVNAYEPDGGFPEAIRDIAGAVFEERKSDMRNRIAAEIINNFMRLYESFSENSFYPEYRKRLLWVGEKINIIRGEEKTPAIMLGADEDCKLHVRYEGGREEYISSGEISIRKA